VMSGSGLLIKAGTGTLTLGAANTFSGGVSIQAGTLSVGADANLGSGGTVSLADAATLAITGSGTYTHGLGLAGRPLVTIGAGQAVTWSGVAADGGSAGALQLVGGGTLTLANAANTYSGGTLVAGGSTLKVGADGVLGAPGAGIGLGDAVTTARLAIDAGGTFNSSRSIAVGSFGATIDTAAGTSATFSGALTGNGSLTKTGAGALTLAGASTFSGATSTLAGTLRAGHTNLFGADAVLAIAGPATVDLNGFNQTVGSLSGTGTLALGSATLTFGGDNSDTLFSGAITGSGRLVKNGAGTLDLIGTNSYTGGLTLNGGTLLATTATTTGNIVNNAAIVFNQPGTGTFSGSMSGTGSFTKTGPGTLILTGANTYTGGTTVSAGTLSGNATSLQGVIQDNAALIFNQSTDGTFNGAIFGSGSLTKTGLGTLTISSVNPFTGPTTISQGTLALNGSLGGDVNVGATAALRGAGFIGGSLNVAGSLFVPAPGSALATFNGTLGGPHAASVFASASQTPSLVVNGNLTTLPGSVLDFTVTPSGVAPIVVNGSASLSGTLINLTINDPSPARHASYVALTAAKGMTVNGLTLSTPPTGIVPILKYDPNAMFVTVLNMNVPLATAVTSPNAAAVGQALDAIKGGATGDLRTVVQELTALDDPALNAALGSLAGELHASELRLTVDDSLAMTDLVREAMSDRDHEGDDGRRKTTGASSVRFWFQLAGDHARFTPGGLDAAVANVGGGGGGFDFRPTTRLTLGGGGSFSRGALSMLGLGGSSDLQAPRAFSYGGYNFGPIGIHAGWSAAKTSYTTQRPIAFTATVTAQNGEEPLTGGINRVAESVQDGLTRDTWADWQNTMKVKTWTLDWKLGWRAATFTRNPFSETGADSISLSGAEKSLKTQEADVDVHVFRRTGTWRPRVLVTYRRQFGDDATGADVQFVNQPAGSFVVNGVPIAQDEFHLIAGVTMRTGLGLEYTFEYETRVAKDENHQGVHFRVRFK